MRLIKMINVDIHRQAFPVVIGFAYHSISKIELINSRLFNLNQYDPAHRIECDPIFHGFICQRSCP